MAVGGLSCSSAEIANFGYSPKLPGAVLAEQAPIADIPARHDSQRGLVPLPPLLFTVQLLAADRSGSTGRELGPGNHSGSRVL